MRLLPLIVGLGPDDVCSPLSQVYATLEEEGLMARCWRLPAHVATDAELLRAHTEEHMKHVSIPKGLKQMQGFAWAFVCSYRVTSKIS